MLSIEAVASNLLSLENEHSSTCCRWPFILATQLDGTLMVPDGDAGRKVGSVCCDVAININLQNTQID